MVPRRAKGEGSMGRRLFFGEFRRTSHPVRRWVRRTVPPALALLTLFLPLESHAASGGLAFVEPLATSLVFRFGQSGAIGLAQGDFNGDGKLDLAATGRSNLNPPEQGGFIYVL